MKVKAELVKAFTKDADEDNPAGVIHDADQLDDEAMLRIAATLGFSESAFIQRSDAADFRVRFFSTKQEVDFCGHATVATFHSLVKKGKISAGEDVITVKQETKAGIFPVTCYADGKIMMTQGKSEFGFVEKDRERIAKLLGLNMASLADLPIQIVSTASAKLLVAVESLEALRGIKPDLAGITDYSKEHTVWGIYAFALAKKEGEVDFYARFFDPILGIDEDAATGVAAGPLACYANKYITQASRQFVISQGFDMGQASTLYADVFDGVQVGGYATSFGRRILEV